MVTHPPPQIQTKKLKRDFSCQTSSHKFKCGFLKRTSISTSPWNFIKQSVIIELTFQCFNVCRTSAIRLNRASLLLWDSRDKKNSLTSCFGTGGLKTSVANISRRRAAADVRGSHLKPNETERGRQEEDKHPLSSGAPEEAQQGKRSAALPSSDGYMTCKSECRWVLTLTQIWSEGHTLTSKAALLMIPN